MRGCATPDADFGKIADEAKRLEMGAGLDSGAEDGEGLRLLGSEEAGGDGGGGSSAHLGDEAAVERGQRLTSGCAEELDDGLMRGQRGVVVVEGDELDSHEVAVDGRHESEDAMVLRHGQNGADGLHNRAGGETDEGLLDCRNERFIGKVAVYLGFVEDEHAGGNMIAAG